jgi:hypothetical protein
LCILRTQKPHSQSSQPPRITLYFQKFLILTINHHNSLEPAICLSNLPSKLSFCFPWPWGLPPVTLPKRLPPRKVLPVLQVPLLENSTLLVHLVATLTSVSGVSSYLLEVPINQTSLRALNLKAALATPTRATSTLIVGMAHLS